MLLQICYGAQFDAGLPNWALCQPVNRAGLSMSPFTPVAHDSILPSAYLLNHTHLCIGFVSVSNVVSGIPQSPILLIRAFMYEASAVECGE